jgi:hypothetical protein
LSRGAARERPALEKRTRTRSASRGATGRCAGARHSALRFAPAALSGTAPILASGRKRRRSSRRAGLGRRGIAPSDPFDGTTSRGATASGRRSLTARHDERPEVRGAPRRSARDRKQGWGGGGAGETVACPPIEPEEPARRIQAGPDRRRTTPRAGPPRRSPCCGDRARRYCRTNSRSMGSEPASVPPARNPRLPSWRLHLEHAARHVHPDGAVRRDPERHGEGRVVRNDALVRRHCTVPRPPCGHQRAVIERRTGVVKS